MSRPESVSSKIANRGLSSSSWTISCRFFSPPEKPSLRLRWANSGSIWTRSIARIDVLHPGTQLRGLAVERRLRRTQEVRTDTPGTSTGYCMARNSPARARSSTVSDEQVLTVEGDAAGGDVVLRVTGDRVRQGRLARTVRAHDRVRLAAADRQVDPLAGSPSGPPRCRPRRADRGFREWT